MQDATNSPETVLREGSPQQLATEDVLAHWASEHCPDQDLKLQISQIATRMNSWIAPRSVHAGISDVMCTVQVEIPPAAISQLADAMCRRMLDDNLFVMIQPRRSGPLG